jgi:hypothetical protein
MFLSKRQAELVRCPQCLGLESQEHPAVKFLCLGSYCMAWRWKKGLSAEDRNDATGKKAIGFCGLAIVPVSDLVEVNSPGR